jgi:hypothetical protein
VTVVAISAAFAGVTTIVASTSPCRAATMWHAGSVIGMRCPRAKKDRKNTRNGPSPAPTPAMEFSGKWQLLCAGEISQVRQWLLHGKLIDAWLVSPARGGIGLLWK